MKNLLNIHDKTKIIDILPVTNTTTPTPAVNIPMPASENTMGTNSFSTSTEEKQDVLEAFEKLSAEEAALSDEKNKLYLFKEQLMQRLKDEIEVRHRSVDNLKNEVTNAKSECEKLVRIMDSALRSGVPTD